MYSLWIDSNIKNRISSVVRNYFLSCSQTRLIKHNLIKQNKIIMKYILLLSLISISCGSECPNETRGFCINNDINPEMRIGWYQTAIDIAEVAVKTLYPYYSIDAMSDDHGPFQIIVEHSDYSYRGLTINNELHIKESNCEFPGIICLEETYVTSHEILHLVADYYLHAHPQDNANHNVENVFIEWAIDNNKPITGVIETIEYFMSVTACNVDLAAYRIYTDATPGICK